MMEKKTLGAFIAQLRKEKGLTQKSLAELLNVSDKTVSHWECDETSPDISLLPTLADVFGITVDELLQGKKKQSQPTAPPSYIPPKNEGFASRTLNKIKSKMAGNVKERYSYFRMLSLIGTVIACIVILSISATNLIIGYYFFAEAAVMAGMVAFIGSLWTLAISLGFTLGARFAFSRGMRPSAETTEEERKYIFKANAVCFNNIFLAFSSLPLALSCIDALDISVFLNIPLVLLFLAVLWVSLIIILNKKGILRTPERKIFALRYVCAFVLSAVIVSLSLLFFREMWHPTPENIIFDNSAEFIAYMETPKAKPDNAYLVDGVTASTYPPTIPAPGNEPTVDSPVGTGQISAEYAEENIGETVLGYCGGEYVTFKWLNLEVYDFSYNEAQGTFHIITYEAKIKAKDQRLAVDDGVPIAIVLFCIADAVACFALYRRKINEASENHF